MKWPIKVYNYATPHPVYFHNHQTSETRGPAHFNPANSIQRVSKFSRGENQQTREKNGDGKADRISCATMDHRSLRNPAIRSGKLLPSPDMSLIPFHIFHIVLEPNFHKIKLLFTWVAGKLILLIVVSNREMG